MHLEHSTLTSISESLQDNDTDSEVSDLGHVGMSPRSTCTAQSPIKENAIPKVIKRYSLHSANQPTLSQKYERIIKFKPHDYRAQKVTKLITEMICLDMQPLPVVENAGFKRLINHLEPWYTFPSRTVSSNKYLNEMFAELSICVSGELLIVQYVSINTDFWTSCAINDMSDTIPEISHTADNIHHFISDQLLQWDLTTKVVAVVRDGGTDITKALNDYAFVPVPCSAHLLQCVVRKAFLDNPFVQNHVEKLFLASSTLKKHQNIETVSKSACSPSTQNDSRYIHTVE
ncbi:hypothetical protein PR048_013111 [Dryococelus australis]|uniref:Transposase n=1 Tax=Dryococelus australis TaxID=614101 RepID=A0ABQ9HS21_9NEOP|nr:hypothetical protein PR048_013111 [Dryococelus australis]